MKGHALEKSWRLSLKSWQGKMRPQKTWPKLFEILWSYPVEVVGLNIEKKLQPR